MTQRQGSPGPESDSNPGFGARTDAPRRVPLSRILGNDRELVIEFNGADYRLRITRNQKLILTK
jgi:hemin uptake protein HemP